MKPIDIGSALQIARPRTGELTAVALYRLLRLVAMEDILGAGASAMSYYAGKKLGKELRFKQIDEFLKLCEQLRIGVVSVPLVSDERIHIDVHECVTCSGMSPVGRMLCHFEGGLMAGAFECILGTTVQAKEVSCIGGFGDASCGFDLLVRTGR